MILQPDTQSLRPPTSDALAQLEERIRCQLSGRIREFRLRVQDEGLILQGHAPTYYVKQLAQHAVMEAVELPIRANNIEVE